MIPTIRKEKNIMDGLGIELPWMLRVVGVMCAYGVVTIIGYYINKKRGKS
ncbi:MAG: hypothetical protein LBS44_00050 [Deltaproteobacteria bacterium]|nr:hypothetical protein [Deltaproteobacteria bacterium]